MGIPVYKIRGHHFLELSHFLYDDELDRRLDSTFTSSNYGEDFVKLEKKIWTDFIEGKCAIELIDNYDKFCLDTECYKEQCFNEPLRELVCPREDGEEDREFIEIAGLVMGKTYLFEEIKGNLHRPQWYEAHYWLMHPLYEGQANAMLEIILEIERSENLRPS